MKPVEVHVLRLLWLPFLIVAVVACSKRREDVEHYGVFELTRYMKIDRLDWEGGNTSLIESTFCANGMCKEAWDFIVMIPSVQRGSRIAVLTLNCERENDEIEFYDSQTGKRINCFPCSDGEIESKILSRVNGYSGQFNWGPTDDTAVAYFKESVGGKVELAFILFDDNGYAVSKIGAWDDAQFQQGSIGFSPDGKSVAWYICNDLCTLRWFSSVTGKGGELPTPCPYNSYLVFGWRQDVPEPEFYWGTSSANMCYLEDGRPAFRRQEQQ